MAAFNPFALTADSVVTGLFYAPIAPVVFPVIVNLATAVDAASARRYRYISTADKERCFGLNTILSGGDI